MPVFETLAAACAPALALDLLVGLALVESGGDPLALRDGADLVKVRSAGEGGSLVAVAADRGRDAGIGLMGLTAKRLDSVGSNVMDAFDPCVAMRAAQALIQKSRTDAERRGVDPLLFDRIAIRDWWRPDGRFVSGSTFEAAVNDQRKRADQFAKTIVNGTLPAAAAVQAVPPVIAARAIQRPEGRPPRAEPIQIGAAAPQAAAPAAKASKDVFAASRASGVLMFQPSNRNGDTQ